MPDRHSMPATPRSTAAATKSSHGSPAWTVTRPWAVASTPRESRCTTVPRKPSSATTTFEPPARTSSGSPAASALRTAATIASSSRASTKRAAGPPRRRVVSSARRRLTRRRLGRRRRNPAADVRRIAAHRRLLAGLVLAAILMAGAFLWLRDSSLVRVERVTVSGAGGPEAPRVREALTQAARDMTTLHVRMGALRDAVRSFPTVKDVRVDRHLLHGLKITIVGRPAVAALTGAGARVAVAADGTLLRGAQIPDDVPSLKVDTPPGGPRLDGGRAALALAMVAAAPPAMRAHVERTYMGHEGLEASLRDGPDVIAGDAKRLRAKWIAAARVLGDPGAKGARYVDVRVPERAVAGGLPTPDQETPQPSTTG